MDNDYYNDQYYFDGLKNRDEKVVREIYKKFKPKLVGTIRNMGGSRDVAEDVFQEALLVILNRSLAPGYELKGSFPGFLFTTAIFKFKNERKKKYNKSLTIEEIKTLTKEPEVLALLIEEARKELFKRKLNELGEKCQKIMQFFFDKYGYKVIKERLGFPTENTAKQAKFRCQKILKEKIQSDPLYKELYNGK